MKRRKRTPQQERRALWNRAFEQAKVIVRARSGGRCERCRTAIATAFHPKLMRRTHPRSTEAEPLAHVLRAGLVARQRPGLAAGALAVAIAGFAAHDMQRRAAAARYQSARITGESARMHAALARITELGAHNPRRMAACLVPVL